MYTPLYDMRPNYGGVAVINMGIGMKTDTDDGLNDIFYRTHSTGTPLISDVLTSTLVNVVRGF